jgi:hypothetical protein
VARYAHVATEELHAAAEALADDPRGDTRPPSHLTGFASPRSAGVHPGQLAAWD